MSNTHVATHTSRLQIVVQVFKISIDFDWKIRLIFYWKTIDFGHERQEVGKNIPRKLTQPTTPIAKFHI